MPVLFLPFILGALVAAPVAGVVGYSAGDGISGASRLLKWALIGGAGFLVIRSGVLGKLR
jgi:hypothetical protein